MSYRASSVCRFIQASRSFSRYRMVRPILTYGGPRPCERH